ncbi:hypothetical protein FRB90_003457 [Tulasnella sp. 427]|nr:hypothetical protein FRB90_003457 [Tulasnella sp. 427]
MADTMDVDAPASSGPVAKGKAKGSSGKKKFEVKKWNAVALWAWDIVVDNCAICRNHIMDLCTYYHFIYAQFRQCRISLTIRTSNVSAAGIDCQANQVSSTSEECNAAWGICNVCITFYSYYGLPVIDRELYDLSFPSRWSTAPKSV